MPFWQLFYIRLASTITAEETVYDIKMKWIFMCSTVGTRKTSGYGNKKKRKKKKKKKSQGPPPTQIVVIDNDGVIFRKQIRSLSI